VGLSRTPLAFRPCPLPSPRCLPYTLPMHLSLANTTLSDAMVILGAAGVVIPAFARIRISPIIGFILVGILVGPHGLGALTAAYPWLAYVTISNAEAMAPFAELGIIMLLFSIGLELSFRRLWSMRKHVFGYGAAELLGSGIAISLVLMLFGYAPLAALGLGLALGLSSTALVLPIAGTQSRVGKTAFSMLLFEDLALVPIIFILGALAPLAAGAGGDGGDALSALLTTLWQGGLMVAALVTLGWFLLPRLFAQAARAKNPELFLAASLLVVIAAALATTAVGLSPIVGALLAGLLIAETDYHGEVEAITAPFKGLALGVFLLTVGMSVDLGAIAADWVRISAAVFGILAINALVTGALLRMTGARWSTAAEVGLLMASPSETTLIVLAAALSAGLIAAGDAAFWQMVTAIGLTVTPLLARAGHVVARRLDTARSDIAAEVADSGEPVVLIVGFGRVGQVIADLLGEHGRAYLAVEADPDAVARARARGYRVRLADAARARFTEGLAPLNLNAIVLTMDDPGQHRRLTERLRARYPDLPIITRARSSSEAAALYRAGATDAVPETLEGSLQLAEAVLVDIGVAVGPVIASVHEHRARERQRIMALAELDDEPRARQAVPRRG
jgi:monovalent cation:H+ antiporter-2, CPA2 family